MGLKGRSLFNVGRLAWSVMRRNWKPGGSTHRPKLKFADGEPIPYRDLFRITTEFWRHAAIISWRAGDVLVLDNRSVAHGRMPFRGKREILGCVTHASRAHAFESRPVAAELHAESMADTQSASD
jgi:hypothetical protein